MRRSYFTTLSLLLLFVFALVCNNAWALKNVCPDCNLIIEDLDRVSCPDCRKIINKCLICGNVNPIRNDNCSKCGATLAESRVSATIDKKTRDDLRLGQSPRARIEVELRQIEDAVADYELTPELGARQIELLTKMGWWSKANGLALEFAAKFPQADQIARVSAYRVTALRNLGFLAKQAGRYKAAREYLQAALSIDPQDKKSKNLLNSISGKR